MWPEDWARRFVTSPVTQTWPTCFSSNRLTCAVSSLTDRTFCVCSAGNSSPKSHCDLAGLLIKINQDRNSFGQNLCKNSHSFVVSIQFQFRPGNDRRPSRFAGGRRPQGVGHAAKVVAENGEFDGVRELARTPDECAQKQPPIANLPPVPHAQHPEGFQEGNAIRPRQVQSRTGRTVALEERPDALVVVPRLVKLLHQFAVAGLQEFTV